MKRSAFWKYVIAVVSFICLHQNTQAVPHELQMKFVFRGLEEDTPHQSLDVVQDRNTAKRNHERGANQREMNQNVGPTKVFSQSSLLPTYNRNTDQYSSRNNHHQVKRHQQIDSWPLPHNNFMGPFGSLSPFSMYSELDTARKWNSRPAHSNHPKRLAEEEPETFSYEPHSPEWNHAMIKHLLSLKAKGHNVREPLSQLESNNLKVVPLGADKSHPGGGFLVCKSAPYNICYRVDQHGDLHHAGEHRPVRILRVYKRNYT